MGHPVHPRLALLFPLNRLPEVQFCVPKLFSVYNPKPLSNNSHPPQPSPSAPCIRLQVQQNLLPKTPNIFLHHIHFKPTINTNSFSHPPNFIPASTPLSMSSLGHAIALPFVFELASMPLYSIWYCNAVAVLFVLQLINIESSRSPCSSLLQSSNPPPLFLQP